MATALAADSAPEPADPHQWLEEVEGQRQLEWVRERNAVAELALASDGEFKSLEQRLLAIRASKLDAYRSLAEQVYGQHLDATTTVSQMTVMSDTFRARVEGVIYGAVLVSITPVGDDTYETTLSLDRAVVEDLRALYLHQLAARSASRRMP